MKNSKEKIEAFSLDFEFLIKQQIDLINKTAPKYIYNTNVLNAKVILYTYIQNVIMTVLLHDANDKDLIVLLSDVNNKIKDLQLDIYNKLMQTQQESIELFKKFSEEKERIINNLQSDLEDTKNQLKHFKITNKTINTENKLLTETISNVKKENNQITSRIFSIVNDLTSSTKLTPNETFELQAKETQEFNYKTELKTQKGNSNCYRLQKHSLHSSSSNKAKVSLTLKAITENQLLEIIDNIYKSKANSDKSNNDSHLPIETLEQHMYTYLNQKYGLKKIIIENATSIINGIKQYSLDNSEICLFGKILRNEIDEESIKIMKELKIVISQVLLQLIKEHNANFNQEKINQYFTLFKADLKPLNKEMIDVIVYFLFSKDNQSQEALMKKVETETSKKENHTLTYSELFHIILNYHIRTRSKYLLNIAMAFRKVDIDSNGIINQDELASLLSQFFNPTMNNTQLQNIIDTLDQYDSNQITFSQVVSYLQSMPITPKANCSLLDIISSNLLLTSAN